MPTTEPLRSTSGPPELPGIDGRVGLHRQVDRVVVAARTHRPGDVGHDPAGHRVGQSERRPDRDDGLADGERVGLGEGGGLQARRGGHLDDREVGGRRRAHDGGVGDGPVVEGDADLARRAGTGDDVVVGQDVAVGVQHDTGAEAAGLSRADGDGHHRRVDLGGRGRHRPVELGRGRRRGAGDADRGAGRQPTRRSRGRTSRCPPRRRSPPTWRRPRAWRRAQAAASGWPLPCGAAGSGCTPAGAGKSCGPYPGSRSIGTVGSCAAP